MFVGLRLSETNAGGVLVLLVLFGPEEDFKSQVGAKFPYITDG